MRQHERYGQLTLVNSTAADTGEFSCWGQLCQGYVCRKDETKTGSTYIFFTGKPLGVSVGRFGILDLAQRYRFQLGAKYLIVTIRALPVCQALSVYVRYFV